MNRLVAQVFAACLGAMHLVVLVGLALALAGVVLNWPAAAPVSELAGELGRSLPAPLLIAGALVVYVLVMGVVSTLVAINQNLERLALQAERRGGYEANT